MYGERTYDVTFKEVYFDSFAELVKFVKEDNEFHNYPTLYYDGTDYVGACHINFGRYDTDKDKQSRFLQIATKILQMH